MIYFVLLANGKKLFFSKRERYGEVRPFDNHPRTNNYDE